MQRNQAALSELGVPDDQSVGRDVIELKSQRLADPESGAGQESEECHMGLGASRIIGTETTRGFEKAPDLAGRVDMRDTAPSGGPSEGTGWRKLVPIVLDLHSSCESPDETKTLSSLLGRRGLLCPSECGATSDEVVVALFGKPREVPKEAFLEAKLESKLTVEFDVVSDVVAQHGAPSGHG